MKLGFFSLMFLMFMGLKLAGCITWPWIWILAPIWGPLILVVVIFIALAIGGAICINADNKAKLKSQVKQYG